MACGTDISPHGGNHQAEFAPISALPQLAYDHQEIINYAKERLEAKLQYTNIAFSLLPDKFTLTQLQAIYEAVMGRTLDKRNFRKKFLSLKLIHETTDTWREGAHRPAVLYSFDNHDLVVQSRNFY